MLMSIVGVIKLIGRIDWRLLGQELPQVTPVTTMDQRSMFSLSPKFQKRLFKGGEREGAGRLRLPSNGAEDAVTRSRSETLLTL